MKPANKFKEDHYWRVCHVTTVHRVPDPRIFLKQCRSLAANNFRVTVLFAGDTTTNGFEWGNIRPVSVGSRCSSRLGRLRYLPRVAAFLRRERPHLIHFHDPELLPLMCLLKGTVLSKSAFIYDVHEDYESLVASYGVPWSLSVPLYRLLARYAEKKMAIILAEDSYSHRFNGPHPVIHNFGVWDDQQLPNARENKFIYVGGVDPDRGAYTMVEAFSRLQNISWGLEIIGGPSNQVIKDEMERLATEQSHYAGQIQVLGYMALSAAIERMRMAKVGLCLLSPATNYMESLPTKVFDYLGAGLPVLLSDFPYYRRFFVDVPGIYFVDPTDVGAITQKLREFCDPEISAARLQDAARGRQICKERFTWQSEAQKLVMLYRNLLCPGQTRNFTNYASL